MGNYYGPYSHTASMYAVLELIGKLYKPRKCHIPITPGRHRPRQSTNRASEYHIHNVQRTRARDGRAWRTTASA